MKSRSWWAVAWMNTFAAATTVIAACAHGNWVAAWFACTSAWFSWMIWVVAKEKT